MSIFKKYKYLPATVLCRTPMIIGCFFEDFINRLDDFSECYVKNNSDKRKVNVLFTLGYHYETPERIEFARKKMEEVWKRFPNVKFYFLCNSPKDCSNFHSINCEAIYCNQNAFLNEKRYFVLNIKKKFDAVYLARFSPIKRHALALDIEKLLLIGDFSRKEIPYADEILKNRSVHSLWIRRVRGIFMFYYLNRAKVGLCLSPEEGAMYACAEYGLCGLPVLTTACLGGRENSLAPQFTRIIDQNPTPRQVADAVAEMVSKKYDSKEIRNATIAVLNEHRQRYYQLGKKIFDDCKQGSKSDYKMFCDFPHKLGVRCKVVPLFKRLRAVKCEI